MSETRIPGIKAQHAIITDQCRVNKGDEAAIDEALGRLHHEYMQPATVPANMGKGVNFHVVLTVERPPRDPNGA